MQDTQNLQTIRQELYKAIVQYSYRENQEEPFVLASGKRSPYYFDLKQCLLQPQYLWYSARLFFTKLTEIYGQPQQGNFPAALGGLTMGADPLVYATSLYAWQQEEVLLLPVIVRKAGKDHGSKKRAEGKMQEVMEQKGNLLLVDDVITTAASTLQAYEVLKNLGIVVKDALCLVDRQEGGLQALAAHSVRLHSVFTLQDFKNS